MAKSEQSSLRIIAGRWKGRRIQFAPAGIRPTADRVRETLFNWLSPCIRDAICLDMFAGTGALGLEALSRGAAKTVFVEQSRQAVSHLKDNITALDCKSAEVIKADARKLAYTGRGPFDVVFIDPPFDTTGDSAGLAKLCTLLESAGCLNAGAHIYIEMAKQAELPSLPSGWEVIRERTAGQVRYALIQCHSDGQPDTDLAKQQE